MLRRIRKHASLMAAVAVVLASGTAALGQTRPGERQLPPRLLDDDRTPPRDGGRDRDDRRHQELMPPMYPGGGYGGQSDFPAREVQTAVESNARAAFTRANFHRAQYEYDGAIRQMQYQFEHSREAQEANQAERQAWNDYVAARNSALKSVVNDPKYKANAALKAELGEQIAEVRATWDASRPTERAAQPSYDKAAMKSVYNLATVKLDYAQVVTDMEVGALRNDSKVADARSRLMAAGARAQALRDNFDVQVRTSTELANLRRQIEDARVAVIASEAHRDGSVEAANVSLDYAYWKNRYNYPNYSTDWPYGYGTRIVRY